MIRLPKFFGFDVPRISNFKFILVLLAAAGFCFAQRGTPSNNEFVGDAACQRCHADVVQTYRDVSMSRSFQAIGSAAPIEDWTNRNRFYHQPSNQYFLMSSHDGRFFQRRYQLDSGGRETNSFEVEIHFAIGSGSHERDYLHRSKSGEFLQLPVVWYAAEKRWGMAPGYDRPDHEGFTRRINYRCVFCHASYPDVPFGADRFESQISLFPEAMPKGIGCERCHGPGRQHAADPVRLHVINPAKLDRKLQMDVCLQCHLETTSANLPSSVLKLGRAVFSFRAGQRLEDYAAYFDYPGGIGHDDDFNIVHQGYRLEKSLCYARSSMTCLTCHDPHRKQPASESFYNTKCVGCHADQPEKHGADCIGCHMPKRRTDDIVHVIMTDHYIQRRPPANLLTPKAERVRDSYQGSLSFYRPEPQQDLYLGLALARGADIARGARLLEAQTKDGKAPAADLFFQLAAAHAAAGDWRRAVAEYGTGLKMDPKRAEARFNMAMKLMDLGETRSAAKALQQSILDQPQLADAYVALGTAESKLGNLSAARAEYVRAIDVDPWNVLALDNLGLWELQAGHGENARTYFQQALRIKPDDPVARQGVKQ